MIRLGSKTQEAQEAQKENHAFNFLFFSRFSGGQKRFGCAP
jgi:hypothetical protein